MDKKISVQIEINGWLKKLLPKGLRADLGFQHILRRKASIKDVIESLGVPHTEIGKLLTAEQEVDFSYHVEDHDLLRVFPISAPADPLIPSVLRPDPLPDIRFLVDANVAKLAALLRMVGFDTSYSGHVPDQEMARIAADENRILLTRDVQLLKRKIISFGHLVRETDPALQLAETVHFYGLQGKIKKHSRCLLCNSRLVPVNKETILERLEPLTKKYYHSFQLCRTCDKVYWAGSHQENMQHYIETINHYQAPPQ